MGTKNASPIVVDDELFAGYNLDFGHYIDDHKNRGMSF